MQIVGSCLFNHNFLRVSLRINLITIAKLYDSSKAGGLLKSHKCAIFLKVYMECLHHVGVKHGPLRSMQSYQSGHQKLESMVSIGAEWHGAT